MKWSKLTCGLFGHQEVEEAFAVKLNCFPSRYDGVLRVVCSRCGKVLEEKLLFRKLSRVELLRRNWFIQE